MIQFIYICTQNVVSYAYDASQTMGKQIHLACVLQLRLGKLASKIWRRQTSWRSSRTIVAATNITATIPIRHEWHTVACRNYNDEEAYDNLSNKYDIHYWSLFRLSIDEELALNCSRKWPTNPLHWSYDPKKSSCHCLYRMHFIFYLQNSA